MKGVPTVGLTKDDNMNLFDLAETYGISFVAALRGGTYTSRQKRHLDRVARRADRREDRLRGKH